MLVLLTGLRRNASDRFSIEDATPLEAFEEASLDKIAGVLISKKYAMPNTVL
mgnify:FL=1